MSYARKGDDSDVYVIRRLTGAYACVTCRLAGDGWKDKVTDKPGEMLHHLAAHVLANHKVPIDAMHRLALERDADDPTKGGWDTGALE